MLARNGVKILPPRKSLSTAALAGKPVFSLTYNLKMFGYLNNDDSSLLGSSMQVIVNFGDTWILLLGTAAFLCRLAVRPAKNVRGDARGNTRVNCRGHCIPNNASMYLNGTYQTTNALPAVIPP
jgi:hypothetical protein